MTKPIKTLVEKIQALPRATTIRVSKDVITILSEADIGTKNQTHYEVRNGQVVAVNTNLEKAIDIFVTRYTHNAIMRKKKQKRYLGESCVVCGATDTLTTDHIIPVSFYRMFGTRLDAEDRRNYCTLCYDCNNRKSAYIDLTDDNTFRIVTKYIKDQRTRELLKRNDRGIYASNKTSSKPNNESSLAGSTSTGNQATDLYLPTRTNSPEKDI